MCLPIVDRCLIDLLIDLWIDVLIYCRSMFDRVVDRFFDRCVGRFVDRVVSTLLDRLLSTFVYVCCVLIIIFKDESDSDSEKALRARFRLTNG